ncbi:MAG TPA: thiamine phosphate synthase [Caulobacteraceae bacterium]|jgi:thiamine-phosphate pyrophosphorylase|nr:thiamine phosphate synthase [Caulobacteraceae bacterium]
MSAGCRLYLITPDFDDLDTFGSQAEAALSAGDVAALQLRLKDADEGRIARAVAALLPLCRARGAALILNDRPALAASLDCDGVHIGQADASLEVARAAVGRDRIVGVTCHASRDLAMDAADGGADYVAFGAFFPTTTKATVHRPEPEILEIWQETMLTPCVAIGGITVDNCRRLVRAGADFIAVCSGVWAGAGGPAEAVRAFNREIAEGLAERPASRP